MVGMGKMSREHPEFLSGSYMLEFHPDAGTFRIPAFLVCIRRICVPGVFFFRKPHVSAFFQFQLCAVVGKAVSEVVRKVSRSIHSVRPLEFPLVVLDGSAHGLQGILSSADMGFFQLVKTDDVRFGRRDRTGQGAAHFLVVHGHFRAPGRRLEDVAGCHGDGYFFVRILGTARIFSISRFLFFPACAHKYKV